MKKKNKRNGFAMVEILIAAVTVISVFTLLYNSVYPVVGMAKQTENYDDLDSKYIAFYIKEMIETDSSFDIRATFAPVLTSSAPINYKTYMYFGSSGYEAASVVPNKTYDISSFTSNSHYLFGNDLCDRLRENQMQKNNQFFCNKYITGAQVTNIYITHYNVTRFKNYVKNSTSYPRSFKSYVKYMPTYSQNSTKSYLYSNYFRIIVEVKHESYNTAGDFYYTYGTIEVKG